MNLFSYDWRRFFILLGDHYSLSNRLFISNDLGCDRFFVYHGSLRFNLWHILLHFFVCLLYNFFFNFLFFGIASFSFLRNVCWCHFVNFLRILFGFFLFPSTVDRAVLRGQVLAILAVFWFDLDLWSLTTTAISWLIFLLFQRLWSPLFLLVRFIRWVLFLCLFTCLWNKSIRFFVFDGNNSIIFLLGYNFAFFVKIFQIFPLFSVFVLSILGPLSRSLCTSLALGAFDLIFTLGVV